MSMKVLVVTLLMAGMLVAGLTLGHSNENHARALLEVRAERLFAYDKANSKVLPAHKLRALSVAMRFHDDAGAKLLLADLEARLR